MKITFFPIVNKANTPHTPLSQRILSAFEHGHRRTMKQFAADFGVSVHHVRSSICSLRKAGYPIFNRILPHSRETQYMLAKPGMPKQKVVNKVYHTMDVPRGKHTMQIS